MNIHDSLLSHETLSQVIKVPLIASWHIKLYGGLAWLGYMRAPPPPCRPGSGGGRRGPPPQRHHGVSCHISFRRWKANEVSLNGYDTSCIISWCFAGSDYICSYDPTTTAAAAACRQPGGGERHASLVVRQNHDPNGQCRGEPGNEIHRRAAAFARRPKLYIPITYYKKSNLLSLSRQGSTEHICNFEKKSYLFLSDLFRIFQHLNLTCE